MQSGSKYPTLHWSEYGPSVAARYNLKKSGPDRYNGPCPNCGGDDRFWIKSYNGEMKVNCNQCGDFKAIYAEMEASGVIPKPNLQPLQIATAPDMADFDDHTPYHTRKGVDLIGADLDGDTVVVRIYNADRQRVGTQRISPNGKKMFSKGMAQSGAFGVVGKPESGTVYVAEGWATSVSVHMATGRPVIFALNSGNLPKVAKVLTELFPSSEFIVAADNDDPGVKAAQASGFQYALPPAGQDWNDLHAASGLEAVNTGLQNLIAAGTSLEAAAREVTGISADDMNFAMDSRGAIPFNHHNAMEILTKSDEWKHVFAFDEFAQRKMVMQQIPGAAGNPDKFRPREIKDSDYISVVRWFNMNGFLRANKNTICDVVDASCHENIISPVRHYLEDLGKKAEQDPEDDDYLDQWAIRMLGVEPQSDEHQLYIYEVSRKWIISAVARALDPGCKADGVLIMEGSQGAGKSTALRVLAGDEWFGDALPQMGTKDASDYLRGKWIVELAELSNINKAEVEIVKAFVSRTEERFRPAYGRSEICYPRHCVFAGTTNKSDYLRDETGNRRFWPIKCGKIDVSLIKKEREKLLGEAVKAYINGEEWWLSGEAESYARTEQDKRLAVDEWTGEIETYCQTRHEVAITEIAKDVFDMSPKEVNRMTQNRISSILSSIGYTRSGKFTTGELRNKAKFVRET